MKKLNSKESNLQYLINRKSGGVEGVPKEFVVQEFRRAVLLGYYILLGTSPRQLHEQLEDWVSSKPSNSLQNITIKEAIKNKYENGIDFYTESRKQTKHINSKGVNLYG
jgi:hypothetical protein